MTLFGSSSGSLPKGLRYSALLHGAAAVHRGSRRAEDEGQLWFFGELPSPEFFVLLETGILISKITVCVIVIGHAHGGRSALILRAVFLCARSFAALALCA